MSNLRRNMNRFFYNHRNQGVANLMLYIAVGNVLVYFITAVDPSLTVYRLLCFDRAAILHGQVWRLLSFLFVYMWEQGVFWGALSLFLYFQFGRMLEQYWGVLRFNLYYLTGVVIMDVAALIFGGTATAYYLNLSIFLAVACLAPDLTVRLYFILPIKIKWLAWIDLGLMIIETIRGVVTMIMTHSLYLGWMFPILAIANFFLFFGKESAALLPDKLRYRASRPKQAKKVYPDWVKHGGRTGGGQKPYRFKCTVCGRTDTDYPGLEFRYCSKCAGYRCYCIDHINNHAHITE